MVGQNVGSRTVGGYSVDWLVGKQRCHTCSKGRSVAMVEWLLLCRISLPTIRASLRKQPVVLRGKFASSNQKGVISIEFCSRVSDVHLAGKSAVPSRNVDCFHRLIRAHKVSLNNWRKLFS